MGSALAEKPVATKARLGIYPDKTRVVFELSDSVSYRVFTLASPYRAVIDLPEVDWRIADGPGALTGGLVQELRYGLFTPGRSRIVLDLAQPSRILSVFVMKPSDGYPYRLVMDLGPVSAQAFLQNPQAVNSDPPLPEVSTAPMAAPAADDKITIVIDAGHGGVDPGAIGASGTYEKDITLAYAKALGDGLGQSPAYRVILTRERDIYVRLDDRRRAAEIAGADLFVSLHADAHKRAATRGTSVYTLSERASDELAAALAENANNSDIVAGIDLNAQSPVVAEILFDLAKRDTMNHSARYASTLIGALDGQVRVLPKPHRSASFKVLKSADVPSVLIELGFLSNPEEERLLLTPEFRSRMAEIIASAVDRYFQKSHLSN